MKVELEPPEGFVFTGSANEKGLWDDSFHIAYESSDNLRALTPGGPGSSVFKTEDEARQSAVKLAWGLLKSRA